MQSGRSLFGNKNPSLDDKLASLIFSHLDKNSLKEARLVNTDWCYKATDVRSRKSIYDHALSKCTFAQHATPADFLNFDYSKLDGGLTNVTYKVDIDNFHYVVRIAGVNTEEFIDRKSEFINASIAARLGINPEIIYFECDGLTIGVQITRYLDDPVPMSKESLRDTKNIDSVVETLKVLHESGETFAREVDVFARNRTMLGVIEKNKHECSPEYADILKITNEIEALVNALSLPKVPCHNDTTMPNFILSKGKMHLIDWEYSGNNYPIWDLVCLAMESDFNDEQCNHLLTSYYGTQLTEQDRKLFEVLKLVYANWVYLWSLVQISNNNLTGGLSELQNLASTRLDQCREFMQKPEFKDALRDLQRQVLKEKPSSVAYESSADSRLFQLPSNTAGKLPEQTYRPAVKQGL